MIVNPRVTLYLYYDSQFTKLSEELKMKFYIIVHKRLDRITDSDLQELQYLLHRLQFLQDVYLDLDKLF